MAGQKNKRMNVYCRGFQWSDKQPELSPFCPDWTHKHTHTHTQNTHTHTPFTVVAICPVEVACSQNYEPSRLVQESVIPKQRCTDFTNKNFHEFVTSQAHARWFCTKDKLLLTNWERTQGNAKQFCSKSNFAGGEYKFQFWYWHWLFTPQIKCVPKVIRVINAHKITRDPDELFEPLLEPTDVLITHDRVVFYVEVDSPVPVIHNALIQGLQLVSLQLQGLDVGHVEEDPWS